MQQFLGRSCRLWVISVLWALQLDVRYYPQSDRNSDQRYGRFVPIGDIDPYSQEGGLS